MTDTKSRPKFSAEMWAAFWAAPDESRIGDILADDIVGYWQGDPKPVRGREPYTAKIVELISAVPDLRLELVDTATVDGSAPGEQLVFLHYVGRAPGPTVRSRCGALTGSAPATEWWSRTSSATTRSRPNRAR